MATSYVSGLAALLLAQYPFLTNIELKTIIEANVDPVEDAVGQNRLNALIEQAQQRCRRHRERGGIGHRAADARPFQQRLVDEGCHNTVLHQVSSLCRVFDPDEG